LSASRALVRRSNTSGEDSSGKETTWDRAVTRADRESDTVYFDGLEILRGHLSRCLGQVTTLAGMEAPNEGIITYYQGAWQLEAYQDPQLADEGGR
jgi:hypothetical protein